MKTLTFALSQIQVPSHVQDHSCAAFGETQLNADPSTGA